MKQTNKREQESNAVVFSRIRASAHRVTLILNPTINNANSKESPCNHMVVIAVQILVNQWQTAINIP